MLMKSMIKDQYFFQEKIDITDCSNPKQIAKKVLKLEHEIFPKAIIKHLKNINKYEKIKRAVISVWDKTHLVELAKFLSSNNIEIISLRYKKD